MDWKLGLAGIGSVLLPGILLTACFPTTSDDGSPGTITASDTVTANWGSNAMDYRGENDLRIAYDCPPNGGASIVWGTDLYTDDSSVCMAAVHSGKITYAAGGLVTIEIRPGAESYAASLRNGVQSSSYGQWPGSFIFP